jgi:hypothetical protein
MPRLAVVTAAVVSHAVRRATTVVGVASLTFVVGVGDIGGAGDPAAAAEDTPPLSNATVSLSAQSDDRFPTGFAVVDRLQPGAVLRVDVAGFRSHARGRVRQCVQTSILQCGNEFPVQFGVDGRAVFQYQVIADFHPAAVSAGGCRAHGAPCTVAVESEDGDRRASVGMLFLDTRPEPGTVRVQPSSSLVDGDTVTIEVFGYPPGSELKAVLCAAPAVAGSERCGPPGPSVPFEVGPEGSASVTLTVRAGPVGSRRAMCRHGDVCGVSVVSETNFSRPAVVPISFAAPPGASYDNGRVGTGLAAAALLIGVAGWLIRRTDWSPVGEAAAPELDAAEYADLDAIVAALPPLEDEVGATSP